MHYMVARTKTQFCPVRKHSVDISVKLIRKARFGGVGKI